MGKPLEEFFKDRHHSTGYDSQCKSCKKEYQQINGFNKWNNKYNNIEYHKKWQKDNKEHVNSYKRNRLNNNSFLKIQQSVRVRINTLIKNKYESTNKYLGCNFSEYKQYIEKQFDENMTWENYGVYWEIDHILPLSKGGSFHYKNTQPLTITENRIKGSKII